MLNRFVRFNGLQRVRSSSSVVYRADSKSSPGIKPRKGRRGVDYEQIEDKVLAPTKDWSVSPNKSNRVISEAAQQGLLWSAQSDRIQDEDWHLLLHPTKGDPHHSMVSIKKDCGLTEFADKLTFKFHNTAHQTDPSLPNHVDWPEAPPVVAVVRYVLFEWAQDQYINHFAKMTDEEQNNASFSSDEFMDINNYIIPLIEQQEWRKVVSDPRACSWLAQAFLWAGAQLGSWVLSRRLGRSLPTDRGAGYVVAGLLPCLPSEVLVIIMRELGDLTDLGVEAVVGDEVQGETSTARDQDVSAKGQCRRQGCKVA